MTSTPATGGDADLAALGAVLAEPARTRMLLALGDGRALPASMLAAEAGVAASTTSGHLARLVDAGLVVCRPQGRFRYYALAGPQVGELIEVLARSARTVPVRSLRQGTRAAALRTARTCYDHLAGRLGVCGLRRSACRRRRRRGSARDRTAPRRQHRPAVLTRPRSDLPSDGERTAPVCSTSA